MFKSLNQLYDEPASGAFVLFIFLTLCIGYCLVVFIVRVIQIIYNIKNIQSSLSQDNVKTTIENSAYILERINSADFQNLFSDATLLQEQLQQVDFEDMSSKIERISQKLPNVKNLGNKINKICEFPLISSSGLCNQ